MKEIKTSNYIISYEPILEEFIQKTIAHTENKRQIFYNLFDCSQEDIGVIKAKFFTSREVFVNYIKSIKPELQLQEWTTGCCCNGEIQILVDLNNTDKKMTTLAHETLHIFFNKLIYSHNVKRLNWLDEAYAVNLDGQMDGISNEKIRDMAQSISQISEGFDMADLADYNKIKNKNFNGYQLFKIIGKYIFETNQSKQFINLLKKDRSQVVEKGKTILHEAVQYFLNKNI